MPGLGGLIKRYGFSCLCWLWDIIGYWTVWSTFSHVPVVRYVYVSSLGSVAFSRGYLCDDAFDTDRFVSNRFKSFVATGAVVYRGFNGDVPGGVVSIIHKFVRRGDSGEVSFAAVYLVWDVRSCNGEPCGLDLIV